MVKIKSNYHSHSNLCDGKGNLIDYLHSAVKKGFTNYGFSGHANLPFKNKWTMSSKNQEIYFKEIKELKNIFPQLNILCGLELDYLEDYTCPASSYSFDYKNTPLDFAIVSLHMINSKNGFISIDESPQKLKELLALNYKGKIKIFIKDYYRLIRKMIKLYPHTIIGHLNLIDKFNSKKELFDEQEKWYQKEIEKTVEVIKKSNSLLEINTGAMSRGYTDNPYPSKMILSYAKKLDIPIIINADAHHPDNIDFGFEKSFELVLKAGYEKLHYLNKEGKIKSYSIQ